MCLSTPAKIISIDGGMGEVSSCSALFRAGLQLIDNPHPGEYILLHAGFAIQRISEKEALEMLELIKEMNDAARR